MRKNPLIQESLSEFDCSTDQACSRISIADVPVLSLTETALALWFEIQDQTGTYRDEDHADVDQRVGRGFGRMLPHRIDDIDYWSAAKHQGHYISRDAACLERINNTEGADRTKSAAHRRPGNASATEALQAALRTEYDNRDQHADQKVRDADAQQSFKRIAQFGLALVKDRAVQTPRQRRP